MAPRLIAVAVGVWLMAAPAAIGYDGALATSDRVVGPLVASLAFVAAWGVLRPLRWATVPFGLWLLLAPWLLGAGVVATVNQVVAGLVVLLTAPVAGGPPPELGGGWRAAVGEQSDARDPAAGP